MYNILIHTVTPVTPTRTTRTSLPHKKLSSVTEHKNMAVTLPIQT